MNINTADIRSLVRNVDFRDKSLGVLLAIANIRSTLIDNPMVVKRIAEQARIAKRWQHLGRSVVSMNQIKSSCKDYKSLDLPTVTAELEKFYFILFDFSTLLKCFKLSTDVPNTIYLDCPGQYYTDGTMQSTLSNIACNLRDRSQLLITNPPWNKIEDTIEKTDQRVLSTLTGFKLTVACKSYVSEIIDKFCLNIKNDKLLVSDSNRENSLLTMSNEELPIRTLLRRTLIHLLKSIAGVPFYNILANICEFLDSIYVILGASSYPLLRYLANFYSNTYRLCNVTKNIRKEIKPY